MMWPSASITNDDIFLTPDRLSRCHSEAQPKNLGLDPSLSFRMTNHELQDTWLLEKDFLIFLLFRFEIFLAETVHLHELDLIGIGEGWVDAFAVDEFSGVGLNLHAFFVKKKVDKGLASVRVGWLGADGDELAVAEHRVIAHISKVGPLFVVGQDEAHERDADGGFAGADAVCSGNDRFGENRFGGG